MSFVKFHDYEKAYMDLAKSYKAVKTASGIESPSSVSEPVFVQEKLLEKRSRTAQGFCIDIEKTQYAASVTLLVDQLHSNRKPSGAQSWKSFFVQYYFVVLRLIH